MNVLRKNQWLALCWGLGVGLSVAVIASVGSWQLAILAMLAVVIGLLVMVNPRWGFFLTASMIPLERFGRFTHDNTTFTISLMRLVGLLTFAALFGQVILRRKRLQIPPAFLWYLVYIGFALVSAFYSSHLVGTVRAGGQLLSNALFFFLVINLPSRFQDLKRATVLWLMASVMIGIYTLFAWQLGQHTAGDPNLGLSTGDRFQAVSYDSAEWEQDLTRVSRAIGSTSHPAVYGINLVLTIPFFFALLRISEKIWTRLVLWLGLGIVGTNLLLTNTRAAILLMLLTIGMCVFWRLWRVSTGMVVAACLAAVLVMPLFKLGTFDRVLDLQNYSLEKSAALQIRLAYWKAGLEVVEENFLWGIGLGNEKEIPPRVNLSEVPTETTVHNEYLQTFMELGLFGFLFFFGFVGYLLRASFQAARHYRRQKQDEPYWFLVACQIAMISVLIYGLQCDVFRFPLKGWWFAAGAVVMLYENALLARLPKNKTTMHPFEPAR